MIGWKHMMAAGWELTVRGRWWSCYEGSLANTVSERVEWTHRPPPSLHSTPDQSEPEPGTIESGNRCSLLSYYLKIIKIK